MTSAFLELRHICKTFDKSPILENLNLKLEQGKMLALLGPSGCGKTTVLRLIAGLEEVDSGQILINGVDLTHTTIQQRNIGMVFQSYALFPHLTIGENVGYGLRMQGISKSEYQNRLKEALALVDLEKFEHRSINQLSGGQQQRVALARALITKPSILLFDEPLSNLDTNLRRTMRDNIRELQQNLGITALYVTHDQSEAFAVADEVVVMNHGKIIQQAPASLLYSHPNSLFIANFMGETNVFSGNLHQQHITLNGYTFKIPHADSFSLADGKCLVGIRPEAIKFRPQGELTQFCTIKNAVFMGNHWEISAQWHSQTIKIYCLPDEFEHQNQAYLEFAPSGVFLLKYAE